MAPHSSILAWEVLWAEEPAGLQPMGSQRVRRDSARIRKSNENKVMSPYACGGLAGIQRLGEDQCGEEVGVPSRW